MHGEKKTTHDAKKRECVRGVAADHGVHQNTSDLTAFTVRANCGRAGLSEQSGNGFWSAFGCWSIDAPSHGGTMKEIRRNTFLAITAVALLAFGAVACSSTDVDTTNPNANVATAMPDGPVNAGDTSVSAADNPVDVA